MEEYGLSLYDAELLTSSKATAGYFEKCLALKELDREFTKSRAKSLSNWILVELSRLLNLNGLEIGASKVTAVRLVELVELIEAGTLSSSLAKTVLEEAFDSGQSPADVVQARGYVQISDSSVVEAAVDEAISSNAQAVEDYLRGKGQAAKFLVGQVMRITKGKRKPELVNKLVDEKLKGIKTG